MSIIRSALTQRSLAVIAERITTDAIRALIAQQLRVNVRRVTDEAHLANDLGADWLDRLELLIAIEDQFAGVEIEDDAVDQLEVVGDLIRFIQTMNHERASASMPLEN